MQIGFLTGFNEEIIKFAAESGFGSIELSVNADSEFFPTKDGWKDKADQVKGAIEDVGLRVSCLGGFYINHMDPLREVEYKVYTRRIIELAEYMKVGVVAGFAGRIPNCRIEESLPKFKSLWGEHTKFAEDRNVKIAFENCPMGEYHTPSGGINFMGLPSMWEKAFNEVPSDALGIEWDPSHLICLLIDPIQNLRHYGKKVYHVHAKDAHINRDLLDRWGIWYPGVSEHCFPGLGDTNWGLAIKELRRQGYHGDLNIEGWHDSVFRDHKGGFQLERKGLLIALRHLSQWV